MGEPLYNQINKSTKTETKILYTNQDYLQIYFLKLSAGHWVCINGADTFFWGGWGPEAPLSSNKKYVQ